MDAETRSAAELVDRVQIEWAALEYVVSGLSLEDLTRAGPDGWSVKDHLAHVGAWDAELVAVLARRPAHEGFGLTAPVEGGIDALNEVLYQRSRDLSIDDVQAEARRAHANLLAALSHLTDADLAGTAAEYGANPKDDRPLREKISEDSYAHYAEHAGWIKTLLAAPPGGPSPT
jgi:hypothetical protein